MIDNAIEMITQSYPRHAGSKILTLLSECPNRPILSTVIELALTRKMTVAEAEQGYYHPVGMPLTDAQTLRELDQRLIRLNELKAQYLSDRQQQSIGNEDESSPYDEEIKQLIRYRKECTQPWGAIKNSDDELRKAYRRHYAAIQRLFARAERDGQHEAVAIVRRSLKLGYASCLRDEDLSCQNQ